MQEQKADRSQHGNDVFPGTHMAFPALDRSAQKTPGRPCGCRGLNAGKAM